MQTDKTKWTLLKETKLVRPKGRDEQVLPMEIDTLRGEDKESSPPDKRQVVAETGLMMKAGRGARMKGFSAPPLLQTTPSFTQTLRYYATLASVATVTAVDLAQACGIVAATSVLGYPIASAVRLKRIRIWPGETALAAAVNQCAVSWSSGVSNFAPDEEVDGSTPDGMSVPRALTFTPPKYALAADWLASGLSTGTVFLISSPIGSIVDVDVEIRLSNNIAPYTSLVLVSATAGLTYWMALDGRASKVYVPLGRPTN